MRDPLAIMDQEQLLDLSFSHLARLIGADLSSTPLGPPLAQLSYELERRGLAWRPDVWLSTTFFSPDGVSGFAVPFYLAHPSLTALERRMTGSAEGSSRPALRRLLRHETGHALENLLGLSRRAAWRRAFGLRTTPYRRTYLARPSSPDFVRNLPFWYAQSHPAEDFAETFAVWLAPRSGGAASHSDGARAKLAAVDAMISSARRPRVVRDRVERLSTLGGTLREYYRARRNRDPTWPFEPFLQRAFRAQPGEPGARAAAPFLPARASALLGEAAMPARWRDDAYSIQQVLDAMRARSRELGLRLRPTTPPPSLRRIAKEVAATLDAVERGEVRIGR